MQEYEQDQEIKNQEFKTESKDAKHYMNRYKLYFDKKTAQEIKLFCKVFYLDISYFIVKTLIPELYFIQEDLEEDHDIFARHFDLNKFTENTNEIQTPKVTKKNCVFEVELHPLIETPITDYCKLVHWTPEEFIVNIIEYKIKDLYDDIKRHNFQFIGIYFDLSKIVKSIDEIYNNKLG